MDLQENVTEVIDEFVEPKAQTDTEEAKIDSEKPTDARAVIDVESGNEVSFYIVFCNIDRVPSELKHSARATKFIIIEQGKSIFGQNQNFRIIQVK